MRNSLHTPVLIEEVVKYLQIQRKGTYIDCTLGTGGHSLEILKRNPDAKVIAFDLDEKSLLKATERLKPYIDRVKLYHSDFRYMPDLKLDFEEVKAILIDLGISSFQLDCPERGFSYNQEGPLDMRMDLRNNYTASKLINKYSEHHLAKIFYDFGELRQARRIAREIVSKRKIKKITTTTELLKITEKVCRWRPQKGKTHPAARVFQALRIEVNQELKGLSHFLKRSIKKMPPQSRIAAISFHSLEDRIVKQTFNDLAQAGDFFPQIKILTKKPVQPTQEEISTNFRSRSAKLRAAERI